LSIQARYTPGTAAFQHTLEHDQRYRAHAYRSGLQPHRSRTPAHRPVFAPAPEQPKPIGTVHPRWPSPLKGTLALSLFLGTFRREAA
jgi:hypothetical protein